MKIEIEELFLPGVMRVTYDCFADERGTIFTPFDHGLEEQMNLKGFQRFCHDKIVCNKKDVFRGIHFDNATTKLVSCLSGRIEQFVICVDEAAKEFGQYFHCELSPGSGSILIPAGYGNALIAKEENSVYWYKLAYRGHYRDADEQRTIKWNDPRFEIDWGQTNLIRSSRDA